VIPPRSSIPLAAWPAEILTHEPAHGLFQRIAECNSQISVSAFANQLGLNGRHRDVAELLEFCLQFPIHGRDLLTENTPAVTGTHVVLHGESFRLEDWSIVRPRVCPGCIAESKHHRNWFDLVLLQSCPIHDLRLEGDVEGEPIGWWCPEVGTTPTGRRPVGRPAIREALPFDTYLLGRLGVVPVTPNPMFDGIAVEHLVEACEIVGCWSRYGLEGRRMRASRSLKDRPGIVAHGYNVWSAGLSSVQAALAKHIPPSDPKAADLRFALNETFGWLNTSLQYIKNRSLRAALATSMKRAARESGVFIRKGRNAEVRRPDDPLTLNELSRKLGVGTGPTRALAVHLGLTRSFKDRSRCHAFSADATAQMENALAALVSRRTAEQQLRVGTNVFRSLCSAAGVFPLMRLSSGDQFAPEDVERIQGEFRRNPAFQATPEFKPRQRHVSEGIGLTDAASLLSLDTRNVSLLVEAGYLQRAYADKKGRVRVTAESLQSLHAAYAPATIYASALRCAPSAATGHLKCLGLLPLPVSGKDVRYLFNRQTAREALGLSTCPDAECEDGVNRLWILLRNAFAGTYPHRIVSADGSSATLMSSDRKVQASLSITPNGRELRLHVGFDQQRSPRRYNALAASLQSFAARWPGELLPATHGRAYTATDKLEGISMDERSLSQVVEWLDDRMAVLRSLFSRSTASQSGRRGPAIAGPGWSDNGQPSGL
jgi:hypothetical protein